MSPEHSHEEKALVLRAVAVLMKTEYTVVEELRWS